MTNIAKKIDYKTGEVKEASIKKERPEEEKEALKREFLLGINGYHVGSFKDANLDKYHNHLFQGDGDYIVVNNKIGKFIVKMRDAERPGLPAEFGGNKIQLSVPKIPKEIYYQIVNFFRDIADTMGNSEAFVQVYYDKVKEEYVCHVPEQTVSGASVRYDAEKNLNNTNRGRYIFVFEVHSHNTMGAFWSGTDNADEKETKFYGVFGKIKDSQIEEKYRFMVMGKQIDVKREHIFDFEEIETIAYPEDWKDNVKKSHSGTTNNYVGGSYKNPHYNANHTTPGYQQNIWDDDDPWYAQDYRYEQKAWDNKKKDNDNTPPVEDDIIDIGETFDIGNYEVDIQSDIIEWFASSMEEHHIPTLLEALVDQGYDYFIQGFQR